LATGSWIKTNRFSGRADLNRPVEALVLAKREDHAHPGPGRAIRTALVGE
jgi:hypothetical protein